MEASGAYAAIEEFGLPRSWPSSSFSNLQIREHLNGERNTGRVRWGEEEGGIGCGSLRA